MKNSATSAAVVPAAIVEDARQEVGASFERFCLTAGLATLADMLEEDTIRVCGPRYGRTEGRDGHRRDMTTGKVGFHGGKVAIGRPDQVRCAEIASIPVRRSFLYLPTPPPAGWRKWLKAMLAFPSREQVEAFVREAVVPALADVAREIGDHDCSATASLSEDGRELHVRHGEGPDFLFAVRPKGYLKPGFAFPEFDPEENGGERYYRAEVHLSEGGQDRDIYGYSKDQVIYEVLDH